MFEHEVDGLLASPVERVYAGVDHEAARPPGVEGEHADAVEIARVQPHLVRQALGVEAPALDEGRGTVVAAEVRQTGQLLADRELQVMARDRLVEGQGLRLIPWAASSAARC